ncbi:hypothetical protein D3C74_49630 [compost metagenome]
MFLSLYLLWGEPYYLQRMVKLMLDLITAGCKSGGVFDNTIIIQDIIDRSEETVFSLPAGRFKVGGSIQINRRGIKFVGNNYGRVEDNATIIEHYGNGPLFQLGDQGTSYFGGQQGFKLDSITLINKSGETGTLYNPYSASISRDKYGANSYAIKDWRGGGIVLTNVQVERFDTAVWGTQSDINRFTNLNLFYNSKGLVFDYGSDQLVIDGLYTIGNDVAVSLYGSNGARFNDCQFVKDGSKDHSPISLDYCNSARFAGCWFEGLNTGMGPVPSFVELGATAECRGVTFRDNVLAIPNKSSAGDSVCDYFVEIIRAKNVLIDEMNGFPKNLKKILLFNGNSQVQQATVMAHIDYSYPDGKIYDQTGTGAAKLTFTNRY